MRSIVSKIATRSLGVKSLRISFSAYSPAAMLLTATTRTGISAPAEQVAAGSEPPLAEHQLVFAGDPDRLQQPFAADAVGERRQIAEFAAMALPTLIAPAGRLSPPAAATTGHLIADLPNDAKAVKHWGFSSRRTATGAPTNTLDNKKLL